MARSSRSEAENSIIARSVVLSSLLLTGLFIAFTFLEKPLKKLAGNYADELVVGLMLLSLWLVVSGSVRSMHSLRKKMPLLKLVLGGVLIALVATVLYTGFLIFYPMVSRQGEAASMMGATLVLTGLFTGAGFVISIIALIQLKVKNRTLAGIIEFALLLLGLILFIYLVG
ncbi:MAG: hypothetical protein CMN32_13020 [Saprospirales bacterium]|nr:hypothetical protein [Saprospirales bacterium]